jgi:DNA polymerase III subunit epsilon
MTYQPPINFAALYHEVDVCKIDVETTDLPPHGQVCEVGFARFERGVCVGSYGSLVNPGVPIPAATTEIHGITDDMVKDAPALLDVFAEQRVKDLLYKAQPGAFSASFDRTFMPRNASIDVAWPWLDTLVLVRKVDRWVKGKGRHKLTASCERHGIQLPTAHRAEYDAKAAGELFYALMPKAHINHDRWTIGELLHWMRIEEANSWKDFHQWLAKQPPLQQQEQQ